MAQNFDIKFRGDASSAERAMESLNRGIDKVGRGALKAGKMIGGIGVAAAAAATAVAGASLSRAERIRRASLTSEVDTGELQRVSAAANIDIEETSDILATLGEAIADAQTGNKTRLGGFKIFGLTAEQVKGKSSAEVLRMIGENVSKMDINANQLEFGLQELSLGDQSRLLKPLLRGNTEELLKFGDRFVDDEQTLETLYRANQAKRILGRTAEKKAGEVTALGALAAEEKLLQGRLQKFLIEGQGQAATKESLQQFKEMKTALEDIRALLGRQTEIAFTKK